ncbi:hypothetical protein WH008_16205 [Enterobacter hormaechei]|uniref:hypothetical protein n=1 Tax=Enterobacter hormaechei TaxID=158836 RepID=UPI0028676B75|nr:hypothetical protein [Enterobacter hormaechei]
MSTLTKEWLLTTITELEEERDATPGAVNEDATMALAAMKRALSSLMAEPVTTSYKLPEGCAVVPVEPTLDMVKAGAAAASLGMLIPGIYKAMLAAAPQQEDI